MEKTIETDMLVVADIADHFVSNELELLRMKAGEVVHHLITREQSDWPESLRELEPHYPQFVGMAVLDNAGGLVVSAGKSPAPLEALNNEYVRRAFWGKKAFTSTCPTDNGVVFYLAAPISEGRILVATIGGMYFTERLSTFVIWKTGHIFIDDSEGTIIANIRREWVEQRVNFIHMAKTDKQYQGMADTVKQGVEGNTGIGRFSVSDVLRICAYTPISGSEEGWFLGIIAPIPESPVKDLDKGLLFVGLIALYLSIIAGIIASKIIKKPFVEVAALKEEAESQSRSKTAFLANMSHEIRTPLNVIIGLTDLVLEDDRLDGHVTENLVKISNAGGTLLSIVNDILDFSKIESGKLEITPVEYYASSLLNDIITLVITHIGEKPVTFRLNIDDNLPVKLHGDDLRVKQIFTNLLSNAIKYTSQGSIELKVRCTREGDTIWMDVAVSDTGIGIREDDLKKLFMDYYQVDTKANRNIEGTGLGLAITKRLAEMMDGEISAESEYGKGSTFHIRIRQGFAGEAVIGRELAEKLCGFLYAEDKRIVTKKLVRPNLSYARVLAVDDMQTNLDVAAGLLRKYKMHVDCVLSGQEAIERIRDGNPVYHAIFMDHMMPGMDGIEAADAIRALGTEYAQTIPIIALTANAIQGTEEMFYQHGFQAFISKPIDVMEMDSVVRKWLRNAPQENALIPNVLVPNAPVPEAPKTAGLNFPAENKSIVIAGLDTKKGMSYYAGETDIYLSLLRSYAVNTPKVLDKLRTVSAETLSDYVITIHGLKGTSAGIGAETVRDTAANLEIMSRAGDLGGVLSLNDKVITATETIVANIKDWLEHNEARAVKPRQKAPDREILARLRRCCENYDMSGIDQAMSELESADYEEDAGLMAWLREKINISELASVAARLRTMNS